MSVSAVPHLHPLGLGQLLDQAIRLYRRNFLKFIGIIAIVQIPLAILQLGTSLLTFSGLSQIGTTSGPSPTSPFDIFGPAYLIGALGSFVISILSIFLLYVVGTAALTWAVAGAYLGQPLSITDAYRKIGQSWLSLFVAFLLGVLGLIVLLIWTAVPCIGWLTGFGMLIFFTTIIFPLFIRVLVLEEQDTLKAIRRAWDLARRRFWWVLGFSLVLFVFAQIIITGPTLLLGSIFGFIFGFQGDAFSSPTLQLMVQTGLQTLIQLIGALIYFPLQFTAITLLYFDLRVRTEGFDLTLQTEIESETDISQIMAQAPEPEKGNWITMTELGYFVLIEIGVVVLYIILFSILGGLFFAFFAASGAPGF